MGERPALFDLILDGSIQCQDQAEINLDGWHSSRTSRSSPLESASKRRDLSGGSASCSFPRFRREYVLRGTPRIAARCNAVSLRYRNTHKQPIQISNVTIHQDIDSFPNEEQPPRPFPARVSLTVPAEIFPSNSLASLVAKTSTAR